MPLLDPTDFGITAEKQLMLEDLDLKLNPAQVETVTFVADTAIETIQEAPIKDDLKSKVFNAIFAPVTQDQNAATFFSTRGAQIVKNQQEFIANTLHLPVLVGPELYAMKLSAKIQIAKQEGIIIADDDNLVKEMFPELSSDEIAQLRDSDVLASAISMREIVLHPFPQNIAVAYNPTGNPGIAEKRGGGREIEGLLSLTAPNIATANQAITKSDVITLMKFRVDTLVANPAVLKAAPKTLGEQQTEKLLALALSENIANLLKKFGMVDNKDIEAFVQSIPQELRDLVLDNKIPIVVLAKLETRPQGHVTILRDYVPVADKIRKGELQFSEYQAMPQAEKNKIKMPLTIAEKEHQAFLELANYATQNAGEFTNQHIDTLQREFLETLYHKAKAVSALTTLAPENLAYAQFLEKFFGACVTACGERTEIAADQIFANLDVQQVLYRSYDVDNPRQFKFVNTILEHNPLLIFINAKSLQKKHAKAAGDQINGILAKINDNTIDDFLKNGVKECVGVLRRFITFEPEEGVWLLPLKNLSVKNQNLYIQCLLQEGIAKTLPAADKRRIFEIEINNILLELNNKRFEAFLTEDASVCAQLIERYNLTLPEGAWLQPLRANKLNEMNQVQYVQKLFEMGIMAKFPPNDFKKLLANANALEVVLKPDNIMLLSKEQVITVFQLINQPGNKRQLQSEPHGAIDFMSRVEQMQRGTTRWAQVIEAMKNNLLKDAITDPSGRFLSPLDNSDQGLTNLMICKLNLLTLNIEPETKAILETHTRKRAIGQTGTVKQITQLQRSATPETDQKIIHEIKERVSPGSSSPSSPPSSPSPRGGHGG